MKANKSINRKAESSGGATTGWDLMSFARNMAGVFGWDETRVFVHLSTKRGVAGIQSKQRPFYRAIGDAGTVPYVSVRYCVSPLHNAFQHIFL